MMENLAAMGLWGFFLLALSERILLVLPSYILFALIGIAAAQSGVSLILGIAMAALGSTVGGMLSFLVGKYLAKHHINAIIYSWAPRIGLKPTKTELWIKYLRSHGITTMLFSQLVPTIRLLAPLLGGLLQLNSGRVAIILFIGSVSWAGLFAVTAYLFVNAYPDEDPFRIAIFLTICLLVFEAVIAVAWRALKSVIPVKSRKTPMSPTEFETQNSSKDYLKSSSIH